MTVARLTRAMTATWRFDPALLGAALVALALRAAWVLTQRVDPLDEAVFYHQHAADLAAGRGYLNPITGGPSAFLPPGYPFLLAPVYRVFGPSTLTGAFVNVVLGGLIVVFTYLLARHFFGRWPARLAALSMALFPSQVMTANALHPDHLFTLLGVMLAWAALAVEPGEMPRWRLVAAGVLLGAMTLVAPKAILIAPALFVAWGVLGPWRRAAAHAGVALAVALVVVAPWTIRNWVQLDAPVFVATNGGPNLWIGHNPDADGGWMPWDGSETWSYPTDEVATDREYRSAAIRYALDHPLRTIWMSVPKLRVTFETDQGYVHHFGLPPPWDRQMGPVHMEDVLAWDEGFYGLLLMCSIAGAAIALYQRHRSMALLAVVAALVAPVTIFLGLDRYHVPLLPFMAIFAAPVLLHLVAPAGDWRTLFARENRPLAIEAGPGSGSAGANRAPRSL